jgi:hypothetical protein
MTSEELVARVILASQAHKLPAHLTTSAGEWRQLAREVGVPCPDVLALLGDALAGHSIVIECTATDGGDTKFELSLPARARATHAWTTGERREIEPPEVSRCLDEIGPVLPFADSASGDVLMLDGKGAVHWIPFEEPARIKQVADRIEDLLVPDAGTTAQ